MESTLSKSYTHCRKCVINTTYEAFIMTAARRRSKLSPRGKPAPCSPRRDVDVEQTLIHAFNGPRRFPTAASLQSLQPTHNLQTLDKHFIIVVAAF